MAFIKKHALIIVFLLTFILAILATFYHFYYTRHYSYLIEGECDPNTQVCYVTRDCPDELECENIYSTKYLINAVDYDGCKDGGCEVFCKDNTESCVQVLCEEGGEDQCSTK